MLANIAPALTKANQMFNFLFRSGRSLGFKDLLEEDMEAVMEAILEVSCCIILSL